MLLFRDPMIGEPADPLDEITRSEVVAAYQHPDLGRMVREKQPDLPNCRADQNHFLLGAQPHLGPHRPITDAGGFIEFSATDAGP